MQDQTQTLGHRWNTFWNGECKNFGAKITSVRTCIENIEKSRDVKKGLEKSTAQLVQAVLEDSQAKPRLKTALYVEFHKLQTAQQQEQQEQAIYNIYNLVLEAKRDQFWYEALNNSGLRCFIVAMFSGAMFSGVGVSLGIVLIGYLLIGYLIGALICAAREVEKKTTKLLGVEPTDSGASSRSTVEQALYNLHHYVGMNEIIEKFSFANKVAEVASSMWDGTCDLLPPVAAMSAAFLFFSDVTKSLSGVGLTQEGCGFGYGDSK